MANRETRGEVSVNGPEPFHLKGIKGFSILHERNECPRDDGECTQRYTADESLKWAYFVFAKNCPSMAIGTVLKYLNSKLGESRKDGSRTYDDLGLISVSTLRFRPRGSAALQSRPKAKLHRYSS